MATVVPRVVGNGEKVTVRTDDLHYLIDTLLMMARGYAWPPATADVRAALLEVIRNGEPRRAFVPNIEQALLDVAASGFDQGMAADAWTLNAEDVAWLNLGNAIDAYGLDPTDHATYHHPAVVAGMRVQAELEHQAPNTIAALAAVWEAELVLRQAARA